MHELEVAFAACDVGLWVADAAGRCLRINPACERIMGETAKEVEGYTSEELVRRGFMQHSVIMDVLESQKPVTRLNFTRNSQQLLCTGTPLFDNNGSLSRILLSLRDVTEVLALQKELDLQSQMVRYYKSELDLRHAEHGVVAVSQSMRHVVERAILAARSDLTVCLTGESGVGKEVVADLIHRHSERTGKAFIKVNCAAIPDTLMEAEFFGYERGAFTGAHNAGKPGYFEMADGGTLFLDEVGDLPLPMQGKLLRILQDLQVRRIGGRESRSVDVRVVAATNNDLQDLVKRKLFRSDLYYRLNVLPLVIPPLRERRADIFHLIAYYLRYFNQKHGHNRIMNAAALQALTDYYWPGNVRELRNVLERLVVMVQKAVVTCEDLPLEVRMVPIPQRLDADQLVEQPADRPRTSLHDAVQSHEAELIRDALNRHGSLRRAAKALGTTHVTILRKARAYGLLLPSQ